MILGDPVLWWQDPVYKTRHREEGEAVRDCLMLEFVPKEWSRVDFPGHFVWKPNSQGSFTTRDLYTSCTPFAPNTFFCAKSLERVKIRPKEQHCDVLIALWCQSAPAGAHADFPAKTSPVWEIKSNVYAFQPKKTIIIPKQCMPFRMGATNPARGYHHVAIAIAFIAFHPLKVFTVFV